MKSLRIPVCLLAAWLAIATAWATPEKYEFDRGHTRIFFEVNHLGFSEYRGMFHDYSGGFIFDEEKLENSKIDVTIDTGSVDMYFDKMNEHLRAADMLDTEKFPTARFISTAIERTGDASASVTGDLTLHGVTRPVVLSVKFNKAAPHPYSKKFTRGFTATGVIDRSEFGIDYAVPAVSKEVRLTISVEGYRVE